MSEDAKTFIFWIVLLLLFVGMCAGVNQWRVWVEEAKQHPCYASNSVACYDLRIQECVALETYTVDQCIEVVS